MKKAEFRFGFEDKDGWFWKDFELEDLVSISFTQPKKYTVKKEFTGMKDVKGEHIFDGDILVYTKIYRGKTIKHYHEVYWDKTGQWGIKGINIDCTHRLYECAFSHEIVGNVWETSELLRKKISNL